MKVLIFLFLVVAIGGCKKKQVTLVTDIKILGDYTGRIITVRVDSTFGSTPAVTRDSTNYNGSVHVERIGTDAVMMSFFSEPAKRYVYNQSNYYTESTNGTNFTEKTDIDFYPDKDSVHYKYVLYNWSPSLSVSIVQEYGGKR